MKEIGHIKVYPKKVGVEPNYLDFELADGDRYNVIDEISMPLRADGEVVHVEITRAK